MYEMMDESVQPLFQLLGMDVTPFALFVVLGCIAGIVMACVRAGKMNLRGGIALTFSLLALPLCVIFGRLIYCLCRIVEVMDNGIGYIFHIEYGGFTVIGTALGALIAAFLTAKINGVKTRLVLDAVMPGLLMVLAFERFAEGATLNGTGMEVSCPGLCFFPIARQGLYGEYTYAVNMGEGITALIASVYTQHRAQTNPGENGGRGFIIVAAAQILFESARRDEVLKYDFIRYAQLFSVVALLLLLFICLYKVQWHIGGKIIVLLGFLLPIGACILVEFMIDGKIFADAPLYVSYLINALSCVAVGVVSTLTLKAACAED